LKPLLELLDEQRAAGFPDVAGMDVSAIVPVSDRLLNELIACRLPAGGTVSDVRVESRPANVLAVRARLTRAAFLPAVAVTLEIVRQPELPRDPVLVLRLASSILAPLAGIVLRVLDALPTGIRLEGDLIYVDLRELLRQHGLADLLPLLKDLRVTTEAGRAILTVRAGAPAA